MSVNCKANKDFVWDRVQMDQLRLTSRFELILCLDKVISNQIQPNILRLCTSE